MTETVTVLLAAVAIAVGLVGIVVPVLPGTLLVLAGILGWAAVVGTTTSWVVGGVATAVLVAGSVVKYTVPGRRLRTAGIPSSTLWAGAALGVVGFFVVPVLGLFLGFAAGVYLAERRRVGRTDAWPATLGALRAVGLSVLIELLAALAATATWVLGLVLA